MSKRFAAVAFATFALVVVGCASQRPLRVVSPPQAFVLATPLPTPIGELRKSFRTLYDDAISVHRGKLLSSYPIVTQDLLNMTLLRPGAPSERFSMKSGPYMLMAHSSHPVLAVYSILSKEGFGAISEDGIKVLTQYGVVLDQSIAEVRTLEIPESTRLRLLNILESTKKFVAATITGGGGSRKEFAEFAMPLRDPIRENFRLGANEQLTQFRAQMSAWRTQFPKENWDELRVVVLGFHQAREEYVLMEFFRWLLREPDLENRVVFAEFQGPISGPAREAAEAEAIKLLTKVDFEHDAADLIFGDRALLQKDVMGPAGEEILKGWGSSDWPASN